MHPSHRPDAFFAKKRHFIFTFHDSTFECICQEFRVHLARGSLRSVLPAMAELLEWNAG